MEWRPIPNFPNYEISEYGDVRRTGHTVTYTTKTGVTRTIRFRPAPIKTKAAEGFGDHVGVTLIRDGRYHGCRVHRLVLEAFVGPPPFPGALGLHFDDNKLNNHVSNLRWGTYRDNWEDAQRNGIAVVGLLQQYCQRGHEFTPDNTFIAKDGRRMCRECQRLRDRKRYAAKIADRPAPTTCRRGHPHAEFSVIRPDGKRQCQECRRLTERERYVRTQGNVVAG